MEFAVAAPPYYNAEGLESLRARRQFLSDQIARLRAQLEGVEFAIRVIERPYSHHLVPTDALEKMRTKKGSLRGMKSIILDILEKAGHVMTASQIADAMYSQSWDIPHGQFKRRVIVTTSAMFKNENPAPIVASGLRASNREIYWALPTWIVDGELTASKYPQTETDENEKDKAALG